MSDGLDLFKERVRKLLEEQRRLADQVAGGFDPRVTLQKLLNSAESPVVPRGREIAPGITEYEGVQPPPMLVPTVSPVEKLELPDLLERVKVKLEETPEDEREKLRKKYPFIGWQK